MRTDDIQHGDVWVPRPSHTVAPGLVWPSPRGRELLRAIAGESIEVRLELTGQHGVADGSGRSDTLVCRAGALCLKTSSRRRFDNLTEGRAALLLAARQKAMLGSWLVPETVLVLQPDQDGGAWLWTVAPWLPTLRSRMTEAILAENEQGLTAALCDYACTAVDAAVLVSARGIVLDVHPSNYVRRREAIHYVDDDIATGSTLPMFGHALVRRVEEYALWPTAAAHYLDVLECQLRDKLTLAMVGPLGLLDAVEGTFVTSGAGEQARTRLLRCLATLPKEGG